MSYCRWSEGDVYLYPCRVRNEPEQIVCCECQLRTVADDGWRGDVYLPTRSAALAHIEEHLAAGHQVPADAVSRLRDEIERFGDDAGNWEVTRG